MKNFMRVFIVVILTVSIAFSATFPRGIIAMKDGVEFKVKKVSIQDNFVYYKLNDEKRSTLLEDVEFIKVRGKVERVIGAITGGATLITFGGVLSFIMIQEPDIAGKLALTTVAFTAVGYGAGRLVGKLFDPWRKIYKAPVVE